MIIYYYREYERAGQPVISVRRNKRIKNLFEQLFICFAAEDRYNIVEPLVYHLRNYGVKVWYDRQALLLGDNRQAKNLDEGAAQCRYSIAVLSKYTANSACAMEELSIIETKYYLGETTVFPILYEILPTDIPLELKWIKELIFKEVDRHSGTREICNHIACKITGDLLENCTYKSVQDIVSTKPQLLSEATNAILHSYQKIDNANLNSRISLLYAAYLTVINSNFGHVIQLESVITMVTKIFERLFTETELNLSVDYRELWLLENSMCILVDSYLASCTEFKI